jgi:hypothetical protein
MTKIKIIAEPVVPRTLGLSVYQPIGKTTKRLLSQTSLIIMNTLSMVYTQRTYHRERATHAIETGCHIVSVGFEHALLSVREHPARRLN